MIFHYIVDAKKKLLAGLSISRGETMLREQGGQGGQGGQGEHQAVKHKSVIQSDTQFQLFRQNKRRNACCLLKMTKTRTRRKC